MSPFPNLFGNSGAGGLAPGSPGKGGLSTTSFTGLPGTASQLTGQVHVSLHFTAEEVLQRMRDVRKKLRMYMWQSWIEIKYYSIAYFERITDLDTL